MHRCVPCAPSNRMRFRRLIASSNQADVSPTNGASRFPYASYSVDKASASIRSLPPKTSSDCVAGAAAVGAGVGPQHLTDILGVAKAFTSRVGAGPFPTELEGPIAEHLRERGGGEYGTTTRRPRRVGWFDLVMLRMAVRVNGLTRLALTKLDVLGGLERVRVCIGYRHDGGVLREFPASMRVLADCAPMYREFPGWPDLPEEEWIRIARRGRRALPETARRYVAFVESQLKVPVRVLPVGRSRAAPMGPCLQPHAG